MWLIHNFRYLPHSFASLIFSIFLYDIKVVNFIELISFELTEPSTPSWQKLECFLVVMFWQLLQLVEFLRSVHLNECWPSGIVTGPAIEVVKPGPRRAAGPAQGVMDSLARLVTGAVQGATGSAASVTAATIARKGRHLTGTFCLTGDTMEGIIQCLVFLKAFSVSG